MAKFTQDTALDNKIREYFSAWKDGSLSDKQRANFEAAIVDGRILLPPDLQSEFQSVDYSTPETPQEKFGAGEGGGAEQDYGSVATPEELPSDNGYLNRVVGGASEAALPYAAGALGGAAFGGPFGALAGLGSVGLTQLAEPIVVPYLNKLLGGNFKTTDEAATQILTQAGVELPKTAEERIVKSGIKTLLDAASSTALGKVLMQSSGPVARGVGSVLSEQPATQMTAGFTGGVVGQTAEEAGGGPIGNLAGNIVGGMAGSKAARIVSPKNGLSEKHLNLLREAEEAERKGFTIRNTDIFEPETFVQKNIRSLGEKVPFSGTGPVVAKQAKERQERIINFVEEYYQGGNVADFLENVTKDLSNFRFGKIKKYKDIKKSIFNEAQENGPTYVLPRNTIKAINDQIAYFSQSNLKESENIIKELLEIGEGFVKGMSINGVEVARKQLKQKFDSPNLASIKNLGEAALSKIYPALRKDMGEYIKTSVGKEAYENWENADTTLAKMMGELEVAALKNTLKKGEVTPETVRTLLFTKDKSKAKLLKNNLGAQGIKNAKKAIISEIVDSAVGPSGTLEDLTPKAFSKGIKKAYPAISELFNDREMKEIEGIQKLLDLTKRVEESLANPATGNQLVPMTMLMTAKHVFGESAKSIVGVLGGGSISRAYDSKWFRPAIVALAKAKNSKEELGAFKRIMTGLAQESAVGAAKEIEREINNGK